MAHLVYPLWRRWMGRAEMRSRRKQAESSNRMGGPPGRCREAPKCIMPNRDRSRGLWTPVSDYESRRPRSASAAGSGRFFGCTSLAPSAA
jgi:hypothetical protein